MKENILKIIKHPLFVGVICALISGFLTYLLSPAISNLVNTQNTNIINNFGNPNESVYICEEFEEINMKKIENISNLFKQIDDLNNLTISKDNELETCRIDFKAKTNDFIFLEDNFKDLNKTYFELKNQNNEIENFFTGYTIPLTKGITFERDNREFTLLYKKTSTSGNMEFFINGVDKTGYVGNKINFQHFNNKNYTLNLLKNPSNILEVSVYERK
jgi:hypothetical protein